MTEYVTEYMFSNMIRQTAGCAVQCRAVLCHAALCHSGDCQWCAVLCCAVMQVVGSSYQALEAPNNATYIGSGKVAEVARAISALKVCAALGWDGVAA